jgi:predicted permease
MASGIVIRQIAILAILVLTGVAASRFRVISSESKDLLAKIIFYVTLPSMFLTNFSKIDLTPELLSGSLQAIFRLHSMLGNIIYLGLPLIASQFGKEGLLYGSVFIF